MEADEGLHLVLLYSYCFVVSREPEVHIEIKKEEGIEFGGSDMIHMAFEILREWPRFISTGISPISECHKLPLSPPRYH